MAYAGRDAAAIGSGKELNNPAVIHISGGSVQARGDNEDYNSYGAGIGAGQNGNGGTILISGGTVYAYGGMDAAGIGCGEKSSLFSSKNSGNITITGGWVYAKGKGYGAGIGAGEDAYCNAVNLFTTAGPLRVEAIAGEQCENAGSIGAYDYDDIKWTLNIGPLVRVDIYNGSTWDHLVRTDDRADRVHHSTRALLYTCDHGGGPIENCNFCNH